jgi:glycosyltransferase involved in cell wall biosynthesis
VRRVLSFQGFIPDAKNRLASKFLIPRMDANVVVSRGMQKWLEKHDGLDTTRNFHLIYNGADPGRLKPTGKSIRTELSISADARLIGMVGNFYRDPRKDQLTVCRSLADVFRQFPNAVCLFAGRTEEGAEEKVEECKRVCLESGIADRVHFLGGRTDVPDILAALDVFVFSSLHEGLPLAVSEAMLAGVAMIVSDIEPLLEATSNGEYARVFRVGDAEALEGHLIELLSDEMKRRELAERAKVFAMENFSIDAHMRKLVELYESLTPRR